MNNTFADIPGGLGMQPGFGVRRNAAGNGFESFDTAPFNPSDIAPGFNTPFQPSVNEHVELNFSIEIAVTSVLLGTHYGNVVLEICDEEDGTYIPIAEIGHSVGGVVSTSKIKGMLHGMIRAGFWVKLRTEETANADITYLYGNQTLLQIQY